MLCLVLLIVGCSPDVVYVYENHTTYINRTINNTTIINNTIPCNITREINTTIYDRQYVLGLIRQLKHYEKQQDDYYNHNETDCQYDLNQSDIKLYKAVNELCQINSSWCD